MKQPWTDFIGVRSQSFVRDQLPAARDVSPDELVDMRTYRSAERGAYNPINIVLAYAQDELAYEKGDYATLPRETRVNKFGQAYRRDAGFYLHKTLADIMVGAALHLYKTQGWTTTLYDGLRTVDGAYKLYCFASDSDMNSGLLTMPGKSAHNKGMAVDSMMADAGREIDMGGHFDHLDMESNSRLYTGPKITAAAQKNRLIRETAFMRSALQQDLLIAPLRTEFWDDRLPENREDLWRVLDSAARCIGISLLTPADERLRKSDRTAWSKQWESWNYADFLANWKKIFNGHEAKLQAAFGTTLPPSQEKPEFYHGNYNPIYDEALKASGKNLT